MTGAGPKGGALSNGSGQARERVYVILVKEEEGMGDIVEVGDQREEGAKVEEVPVVSVVEEGRDGERVGRVEDV